jgi:putative effector of murein hydrolase
VLTLALYGLAKKLYRRTGSWWTAPLAVPLLVIGAVVVGHIPYHTYFQDTHWLSWLLGPATVAFAIPIYEQRQMIRKHALSLSCGVLVAMPVAVMSSVWLARAFGLSELLQKSLAPRSISTPFAMATASSIGAPPDLTAVFVVITGVAGMLLGELMLMLLPLRSGWPRGFAGCCRTWCRHRQSQRAGCGRRRGGQPHHDAGWHCHGVCRPTDCLVRVMRAGLKISL